MSASSRYGVASLCLGCGIFGANVAVLVIFFVVVVVVGFNVNQNGSLLMTALGVVVMASPLGHLVGLSLGIAGLVRREPRRIAAVLGALLNGVLLLGAVLIGLLVWLTRGM